MTAIEQTNVDESIHQKPNSYLLTFKKQTIMAKFLIVLAVLAIIGTAASFSMSMSSTDRRSFVRTAGTAGAAVLISPGAALADAVAEPAVAADFITTESGMKYRVTKEGTGAIPEAGQTVKVSSDCRMKLPCLLCTFHSRLSLVACSSNEQNFSTR